MLNKTKIHGLILAKKSSIKTIITYNILYPPLLPLTTKRRIFLLTFLVGKLIVYMDEEQAKTKLVKPKSEKY